MAGKVQKSPLNLGVQSAPCTPLKVNDKKEITIMVKKLSMEELIKKNKEEFLKDKDLLDKIEKRLEQKYVKQSEYIGGDK